MCGEPNFVAATKHEPFINPFSPVSMELGTKQAAQRGCRTADIEDNIISVRDAGCGITRGAASKLDAAVNPLGDQVRYLVTKYGTWDEGLPHAAAGRVQAAVWRKRAARRVTSLHDKVVLHEACSVQAGAARSMLARKLIVLRLNWDRLLAELADEAAQELRRCQTRVATAVQYAWRGVLSARARSKARWTCLPVAGDVRGKRVAQQGCTPAPSVTAWPVGGGQLGLRAREADEDATADEEEPAWLREAA